VGQVDTPRSGGTPIGVGRNVTLQWGLYLYRKRGGGAWERVSTMKRRKGSQWTTLEESLDYKLRSRERRELAYRRPFA
jgi:hypothetical protein